MIFVYVTVPDVATAKKIAKIAVRSRLAACANILPKMIAVYEWKNKLATENETVLILKTLARDLKELTRKIEELHPYDVPCIVSFKSHAANGSFADWVERQTR